MGSIDASTLHRENARLLAQAELLSSDDWLRSEARRWRDATARERLAETWRLCSMAGWLRKMWPPGPDERGRRTQPLPAEVPPCSSR